jgi:hypothetical protein
MNVTALLHAPVRSTTPLDPSVGDDVGRQQRTLPHAVNAPRAQACRAQIVDPALRAFGNARNQTDEGAKADRLTVKPGLHGDELSLMDLGRRAGIPVASEPEVAAAG